MQAHSRAGVKQVPFEIGWSNYDRYSGLANRFDAARERGTPVNVALKPFCENEPLRGQVADAADV